MYDPLHRGRDALRNAARERIEQARLPGQKPTRTWGGRGTGQACNLCDTPILDSEPEMELEFEQAGGKSVVHFHLQCQAVWDEARQITVSPWTLVSAVLPPLLHIVEARVSLSDSRAAIIINVMRVNHGDTGPLVWLNATTNSPLPENWRPLEWRPLAQQVVPAPLNLTSDRASQRA